jgi:hypothetical protein
LESQTPFILHKNKYTKIATYNLSTTYFETTK